MTIEIQLKPESEFPVHYTGNAHIDAVIDIAKDATRIAHKNAQQALKFQIMWELRSIEHLLEHIVFLLDGNGTLHLPIMDTDLADEIVRLLIKADIGVERYREQQQQNFYLN